MQPETTIAPDMGPRINDEAAAHIAGLTPDQKASVRASYAKAFSPQELDRVFGPTPAPTPVVTQGNGPILSPAEKAAGYVSLFKHAADKTAVVEAARRDGVNLQADGKISDAPVAKESLSEPTKPAPQYRLQWPQMPGLRLDEIRALDADLKAGFAATGMTQAEGDAVFGAIVETIRAVPKSDDERKAFFEAQGKLLEQAYGESQAKAVVELHSAWFKRLPAAVQEKLAGNYSLHSASAIIATAQAEQRYRARKKS
jgi:hypothetical protein